MPAIDIVMVNYNSTPFALKSIESIKEKANGTVSSIVVVDNGSCDNPERISHRFSDVQFLPFKENLGFSKAINLATRECKSDYLAIFNPDTILLNDFFEEVLEYLKENREVGVVGPRIFETDGKVQGSARRFPTIWSFAFGRKSPLTRLFPNNRISRREFLCFCEDRDQEIEVDWVSGACMVLRREAYEAVGGFDDTFFLYWEDTDLCKRIKETGRKIVYYPKAEIEHIVGMSSITRPIHSICHFHYSCYKLLKKHTRWPFRAVAPFAFLALAFRCLFVIGLKNDQQKSQSNYLNPYWLD
jgi:GT2 family glycosyltransferase